VVSKAKKAAKAAKKTAKEVAAFREAHNGACPKCSHPAWQHRRREEPTSLYSMFIYGDGHRPCQGTEETPGEDGLLRIKKCECDLSPAEAQLNANKKSGLKGFDQLMASLTAPKDETK
jgi:hypothetical protein